MFDGAPCDGKLSRTVLSGGKSGDYFKGLPIAKRFSQLRWHRQGPLWLPGFSY